jgi:hypothetical protein
MEVVFRLHLQPLWLRSIRLLFRPRRNHVDLGRLLLILPQLILHEEAVDVGVVPTDPFD